jgi:hypothetical protein
MAEAEGEVTLMDVKGRYMAVVTQNNMIKIFDRIMLLGEWNDLFKYSRELLDDDFNPH